MTLMVSKSMLKAIEGMNNRPVGSSTSKSRLKNKVERSNKAKGRRHNQK